MFEVRKWAMMKRFIEEFMIMFHSNFCFTNSRISLLLSIIQCCGEKTLCQQINQPSKPEIISN